MGFRLPRRGLGRAYPGGGGAKGPGEQVSAAGGGARGGAEPGDDGGDRAVPGGGVRDAGLGGAQGRHHAAGDGRGGADAATGVPCAQADTGERVTRVGRPR